MFTVEIRVNGTLIGHIYGRNVTPEESLVDCLHDYTYEYYEPERRKVRKGHVTHGRAGGIRPLIAAILADIPAEKP